MKTGVIAFCGSKGSGKSTASTIFKEHFTGPTEELAFAGHLKDVCSKIFDININHFLDPALKECELDSYVNLTRGNIQAVLQEFNQIHFDYNQHVRTHVGQVFDTPRSLLQYIGTEVLHPLDPLIHVKATLDNKDPNKLTIITDLRFVHEYIYLNNLPKVATVYVANLVAESRAKSDNHKSEREIFLFKDECRLLDNNHDLVALTSGIKTLVKEWYA